jgi:Intracellular proteinase inhibitor
MYELEARLRGRTLWRWSEGRFFTRSFTQLVLPAGSRKEFHISFPIARGTAPGDYELVAYLTPTGFTRGSAGEATTRLRIR